jgi:hypothetical protein
MRLSRMSNDTPDISVTRLRALVRDAVIAQLVETPLGFRHNDVADRIGPEYRAGGVGERRLRRQLESLCRSHLLHPADRGLFVGGLSYIPEEQHGLAPAIYEAFYRAGGALSLPELMGSLTGHDVRDRVVARVMRESGRYFRGLPLRGFRQQWFLTDPERLQVPLPGDAQMLELRIFQLRRKQPISVNLVPQLDSFRKRVGAAIRQARELRGLSPRELLADPTVADRLTRCLSACRTGITDPELGTHYRSVAEWWAQDGTLETAWRYLESDDRSPDQPFLLGVIDVACWDALGAALGVNAALLSRGLLSPA